VSWDIGEAGQTQIEFVKKLTQLRRDFPILRRNRFLTGALDEDLGVRDVTWINATGEPITDAEWADANMRCFGMQIDGRAQATGIHQRGSDVTVLLVLNAHHDVVKFTLPDCSMCTGWKRIIDTNIPGHDDGESFSVGDVYDVTARSLVAFQLTS